MSSRAKAYCFTVNNPGEWTPASVWDANIMDYMIAQKERGEQGTEHYQGYVRFKAPCTLGGARTLFIAARI